MGNREQYASDWLRRRARSEGYVARSIYKLREIQRRFGLLRPGMKVLDLGAAPGSWTQYCLEMVGGSGRVVAVDLHPLSQTVPRPNLLFIQSDIGEPSLTTRLAEMAHFQVLLSDAAPTTSGNRLLDTARSAALARRALEIAIATLAPGGCMVIKLFQGGEEHDLLELARRRFRRARCLKPAASRSASFETYLIADGFEGADD